MTPDDTARRSAEAMWAGDRASQGLGMTLDSIGPGTATVSMILRDDMVNGHAIGHGGLTFTLADSAFAFACNSYNRATVAAGAEIRFRRPTRLGDRLVATATERERDGRDGVYDVLVTVGDEVVAVFVGHSREIDGTLFDVPEPGQR
ncbi:hydroxyphenylacetyl-CoA thioesterase PaaI [Nocardioides cynanchi]|uniref:hydroxyphenylacetyl-CoA thioesterase PaaI n=1 Tax=Nocardioides cynanchi TaxID=2558918 RepID=UPI001EE18669|nr:hydroxyphenylacetyl-CoA thioesterase PaaI [Nocardioides cynanchi]